MKCLIMILVVGITVSCFCLVKGDEVKNLLPCNFSTAYAFGDSNSDTGGSSAVFYPIVLPNGQTFFHRAAGRASDGRLIIDFIAEYLHLPYFSPYLDSIVAKFKHGVNFASGGSTIAKAYGNKSPFSLDIQIAQFKQFKARTSDLYKQGRRDLPSPETLSKALYMIDIGQNDLSDEVRRITVHHSESITYMVDQLAAAIQSLYDEGARAFWIHNTGPIGCLPHTLSFIRNPMPAGYLDQQGCVKNQNDLARFFNNQLKDRVAKLRVNLSDAALTYVDVFAAKYGLIGDAKKQGFVDPSKICCGHYENETRVSCGSHEVINGTEIYGAPCNDPSTFISWDGVHYTEAANKWIADRILNGSFSDPPIPITQACHRI